MDPDSSRLSIIAVIVLFIIAFYLAVTETAIAAVSKTKIKVRAEKGSERAKKVLYVLDHFDEAITTILILTNIAHLSAAAIITVFVTKTFGISFVALGTVLTAVALFFVAEMLPKSIGKKLSERSSLACAGLLVVLMKILRPVSFVLP